MKTSLTVLLVTIALLSNSVIGGRAEPGVVFKFENVDVVKVLEVYRELVDRQFVIASNVKHAAGRITVQTRGQTAKEAAARMLQRALLEQAGVVVTFLEDERVSVTYNDVLRIRVPEAKPK